MRTLMKTTWVELKLFAREPLTVLFTFAIPFVVLFVLGGVFGNRPADPHVYRGFGILNYYVPAYIALVVAAIGLIALPVHLAAYRERGVLRRFRASTIPVWSVLGGQVAATFLIGVLASLILVVLALAVYHTRSPQSLVGVLAAFFLGAIMFATLGLFLGLALPTARAAQGAGVLLWFVMMQISGPGAPPEVLPTALLRVADATPLKHLVVLMQDPWFGLGWNGPEMLIVLGFFVVAALLTIVFARRS
jgi:ABC-2 type transport system permease protein